MIVPAWLHQAIKVIAASAMAAAVGWWAIDVNLTQSCVLGQWPYFSFCKVGAKIGPIEEGAELQRRLSANPGDGLAWIALASVAQRDEQAGLDRDRLSVAALKAAGEQPELLHLKAVNALRDKRWDDGVAMLVRLAEQHRNRWAVSQLAGLIQSGVANDALFRHLTPSSKWLGVVVQSLPANKVSATAALPVLAKALPMGLITPPLAQALMGRLKLEGNLPAAYALWIALLRRPAPAIYNGDFEQRFFEDSFDWDISDERASKAGAVISQARAEEHGLVLNVRYSGRALREPVVQQLLMLPSKDEYRFTGEYAVEQLRASNGLAWVFTCVANSQEIARAGPLLDTAGRWQRMALVFRIPPGCGAFVALQLQPFEMGDAVKGLRGQALFDNFRLDVGSPRQP